jgi:UDP-N-acetylglucosamine 2-epimerase (non-hydrolysing)
VLIDHLADLCCAPTRLARDNLLAERITPKRIEVTGNTIVEAVTTALPNAQEQAHILDKLGLAPGGFVLATIHRPKTPTTPSTSPPSCANWPDHPCQSCFPCTPERGGTSGLSGSPTSPAGSG